MSATPVSPAEIAGRYRLGERLGVGGMATVYRAEDQRLGRTVAIKLLDDLDSEGRGVERVEREARRGAILNHPRIVQVHDAGVAEDERPYIVMEYVEGPTLADVVRGGPLGSEEAAELAIDLCDALAAAHRHGITHRDLKPANVLLDADGRPKLTDFGIAREREGNTVTREDAFGSAPYLAPEQLTAEDVDERADLYALGIVLYELLTGRRPFEGDTIAQTAWLRVHTDPLPPSELADVDPGLEDVVMRALARDPADRFSSAEDLATELRAATAARTTPVLASGAVAAGSSTSRWRGLATVGVAVVAAALVGVLSWWPSPGSTSGVAVPDVSGMTLEAATRVLGEQDLEVGDVSRGGSTEPEGLVLGQDPAFGSSAAPGTAVSLHVSAGPHEDPASTSTEAPGAEAVVEDPDRVEPRPGDDPPAEAGGDDPRGGGRGQTPPGHGGEPPGRSKGRG